VTANQATHHRVPPGIRAMAIGAFWFSIMSLLVKVAGRRLPSMEVVFFRGLITLVISWVALRHAGVAPFGTQRRLLIARGVLGTIALSCFYFSVIHLPLAEATVIQYTNPVFATLLAAWWLRERAGRAEVFALVLSLIGVLCIARPSVLFGQPVADIRPAYVLIALLGAMCSGAAYVLVRRMGVREHRLVVVFYLPLLTVPMVLPFALMDWTWPRGMEWLALLGIGATTQLAQVNMTRGLQLESSARATTVGYLQIVFATLWGAVLLSEIPDAWSILGGLVIVIGSVLLARVRRRPGLGVDQVAP
jgi:drug/metabolite transporter (DMT)-like permease